jgi:hypothetical protein
MMHLHGEDDDEDSCACPAADTQSPSLKPSATTRTRSFIYPFYPGTVVVCTLPIRSVQVLLKPFAVTVQVLRSSAHREMRARSWFPMQQGRGRPIEKKTYTHCSKRKKKKTYVLYCG